MNPLVPFDFFLLRTPRFSTAVLDKLNPLSSQEEVYSYILQFFENPETLQALYFANTEVYDQLVEYTKTGTHKKKEKLFTTLYRYLIRMSSRPTPFGQFAGISYGQFSWTKTSLQLSKSIVSHIRFDQELRLKASQELLSDSAIKENITYFPNSTLVYQQTTIAYIGYIDQGENRYFQWRKIQDNPLLSNLINLAKEGMTYHAMTQSLTALRLSKDQANGYIDELIAIKLLIPELEPIVTRERSHELMTTLSSHLGDKIDLSLLPEVAQVRQHRDAPYDLSKLTALQQQIQASVAGHFKHIYQVDYRRNTVTNQIDAAMIQQLSQELTELSILNKNTRSPDLITFINKFQSKYGERKIPLMEALDPEIGIGYGMASSLSDETVPLLENFNISSVPDPAERFNAIIQTLMDEKSDHPAARLQVLELKEHDLQRFQRQAEAIANKPILGMYLLGNLLWDQDNHQADDPYKFNLLKAGGASALPLMTRFDHLDPKLKEKLLEIAAYEEKQVEGAILAEVIFLPNARAGNVLARSSLYQYEIPIICQAAVQDEYTIKLEDIEVTVKDGNINLISKRLNKEIIPRLSSAHNFHYGMVIYRFLCDLQKQDWGMDLQWDWGSLSAKTYLPRVTYKHFILSRARWKIKQQHLSSHHETDIQQSISFLKSKYGLPDRILLTEGDHELFLDLNSVMGAKVLLQELSKNNMTIVEYLYDHYQSVVQGENGEHFNNEIIIPCKVGHYKSTAPLSSAYAATMTRQFPLGTEWLYVKLYAAERTFDRILSDPIPKLIALLHEKKYLKKWFFIRYSDPDPHVRIRIKLREQGTHALADIIQFINQYCEPFISQKKIFNIQYDTYDRELERYGASNMGYCEQLFHAESELILNLLPHLKTENNANLRWLIALKGAHIILSSFHLTVSEKIALTEKIRDQFLVEFNNYKKLRYSMDMTYRAKYHLIHDFFKNLSDQYPEISHALDHYNSRIKEISIKCLDTPEFKEQPQAIMAALIHMFFNRIFAQKQREQEMVVYHFLSKYLRSSHLQSSAIAHQYYSFPESPNLR